MDVEAGIIAEVLLAVVLFVFSLVCLGWGKGGCGRNVELTKDKKGKSTIRYVLWFFLISG